MIYLPIYVFAASVVSVWALSRMPTKMSPVDNIGGSLVAGIASGWLLWPFILLALRKTL